jgi:AraC family ethanolamine operon transcriptional activator
MILTQPSWSVQSDLVEDVDAMSAAIGDGLRAEYVQLEAKPFGGRWAIARGADMVMQFAQEEIAVARRIRVPANRWAFIVPCAVPESARWNARAIHADDLIVCAPGSECYAFDPGGTRFAIVSVEAGYVLPPAIRDLVERGDTAIATLPGADAGRLRWQLAGIGGERARPAADGVARSPELNQCLAHAAPATRPVEASTGRSQIVRRVEEFFRRHVGEPVSIARLSSIAGVSERSLRNAFYDVYTTSPKRYLKLWQLHQVRRALRSPVTREETVTNVATFHGFYELGRFAGEYKALFGEAPSQTLHKARMRQASSACGAA